MDSKEKSGHSSLIKLPHPNLRERSKKVGMITDEIKKIIADMESATLEWEDTREHEVGVALAAVQINVLRRIVIIRNNFDNKNDRSFRIFINPKIVKYDGDVVEEYEGCLSVKELYGKVPRYSKVKVTALNEAGKEIRVTAEGFLARVFQHEIDHTNGILFVDRIKDNPEQFHKLGATGKIEQLTDKEREEAVRLITENE